MKEFLAVMTLIVPMMLPFGQVVADMVNHDRMSNTERTVEHFAQKARGEGRFTPQIIDDMKRSIADQTTVDYDEIIVNATTTMKYRKNQFDQREMIKYEVIIPIDEIIAGAQFYGYSEAENSTSYNIKGEVQSEVNMP